MTPEDYNVYGNSNISPGDYTMNVVGKGNFTNTVYVDWSIYGLLVGDEYYSTLTDAIENAYGEIITLIEGAIIDGTNVLDIGNGLETEYLLENMSLSGEGYIVMDGGLDFGRILCSALEVSGIQFQGDSQSLVYLQNIVAGSVPTTLSDLKVHATGGSGIYAEFAPHGVILNDCTVHQSGLGDGYLPWFETAIAAAQGSHITVNSGYYESTKYALCTLGSEGSEVTINGGTFIGELMVNPDDTFVINGGTFDYDPSAYLGVGKTVNDNGDGTWTVI